MNKMKTMKTMTVIKDVKVVEVPGYVCQFHPPIDDMVNVLIRNASSEPAESMQAYDVETITGRIFIDPNGYSHNIGMSRKVYETLKIPINAFNDLVAKAEDDFKLILEKNADIKKLNDQLTHYENMGFWARLKFLFKG